MSRAKSLLNALSRIPVTQALGNAIPHTLPSATRALPAAVRHLATALPAAPTVLSPVANPTLTPLSKSTIRDFSTAAPDPQQQADHEFHLAQESSEQQYQESITAIIRDLFQSAYKIGVNFDEVNTKFLPLILRMAEHFPNIKSAETFLGTWFQVPAALGYPPLKFFEESCKVVGEKLALEMLTRGDVIGALETCPRDVVDTFFNLIAQKMGKTTIITRNFNAQNNPRLFAASTEAIARLRAKDVKIINNLEVSYNVNLTPAYMAKKLKSYAKIVLEADIKAMMKTDPLLSRAAAIKAIYQSERSFSVGIKDYSGSMAPSEGKAIAELSHQQLQLLAQEYKDKGEPELAQIIEKMPMTWHIQLTDRSVGTDKEIQKTCRTLKRSNQIHYIPTEEVTPHPSLFKRLHEDYPHNQPIISEFHKESNTLLAPYAEASFPHLRHKPQGNTGAALGATQTTEAAKERIAKELGISKEEAEKRFIAVQNEIIKIGKKNRVTPDQDRITRLTLDILLHHKCTNFKEYLEKLVLTNDGFTPKEFANSVRTIEPSLISYKGMKFSEEVSKVTASPLVHIALKQELMACLLRLQKAGKITAQLVNEIDSWTHFENVTEIRDHLAKLVLPEEIKREIQNAYGPYDEEIDLPCDTAQTMNMTQAYDRLEAITKEYGLKIPANRKEEYALYVAMLGTIGEVLIISGGRDKNPQLFPPLANESNFAEKLAKFQENFLTLWNEFCEKRLTEVAAKNKNQVYIDPQKLEAAIRNSNIAGAVWGDACDIDHDLDDVTAKPAFPDKSILKGFQEAR